MRGGREEKIGGEDAGLGARSGTNLRALAAVTRRSIEERVENASKVYSHFLEISGIFAAAVNIGNIK